MKIRCEWRERPRLDVRRSKYQEIQNTETVSSLRSSPDPSPRPRSGSRHRFPLLLLLLRRLVWLLSVSPHVGVGGGAHLRRVVRPFSSCPGDTGLDARLERRDGELQRVREMGERFRERVRRGGGGVGGEGLRLGGLGLGLGLGGCERVGGCRSQHAHVHRRRLRVRVRVRVRVGGVLVTGPGSRRILASVRMVTLTRPRRRVRPHRRTRRRRRVPGEIRQRMQPLDAEIIRRPRGSGDLRRVLLGGSVRLLTLVHAQVTSGVRAHAEPFRAALDWAFVRCGRVSWGVWGTL